MALPVIFSLVVKMAITQKGFIIKNIKGLVAVLQLTLEKLMNIVIMIIINFYKLDKSFI